MAEAAAAKAQARLFGKSLGTILLFHFLRCDVVCSVVGFSCHRFSAIEEQLHAVQAEAAENSRRFDALNQAAVAAICTVAPVGATVEEHLRALPAQVVEVTRYGICHGPQGRSPPPSIGVGACVG
jgi:hypothetical protein